METFVKRQFSNEFCIFFSGILPSYAFLLNVNMTINCSRGKDRQSCVFVGRENWIYVVFKSSWSLFQK